MNPLRNCLVCTKFVLYPVEQLSLHPETAKDLTRFRCSGGRFTGVALESTDELRALCSQAAFCPKFKPLSA